MSLSILIPTLTGREHWLADLEASLDVTAPDAERIIVRDAPNWGVGINEAAEQAKGDYLLLASDDHTYPHPGWWQSAADFCDNGVLPAPLVYNTDGTIQSCGDYYGDRATRVTHDQLPEDRTETPFPRIPFLSRAQWDRYGPLLPIHFSDVFLGTKAKFDGTPTVVCKGFQLVHHFAQEGRLEYGEQERIRVEMEREILAALN
jgi:GT2 family glycosyltransferase